MTALYQLSEEYQTLQTLLAEEDDPEAFDAALAQLQGEIAVKAENIGLLIKTLEAEAKGIEVEVKRLSQRQQVRQNRAERLRQYLAQNIPEDKSFEFPFVTIKWAKNPASVEVVDESAVEAQFLRIIPETSQPNKVAIKAHWKETGEVPAGVVIVDDVKRLVVK